MFWYYVQADWFAVASCSHAGRVGLNLIPEMELQLNSNSNFGIEIEIVGIENGIGIETHGIGIENRNQFFYARLYTT